MEIFRDDDSGYIGWLGAHPDGFVLNTPKSPLATYLVLHRSSCHTISKRPARGEVWTGEYIKICSDEGAEIAAWSSHQVNATPTRCRVCFR